MRLPCVDTAGPRLDDERGVNSFLERVTKLRAGAVEVKLLGERADTQWHVEGGHDLLNRCRGGRWREYGELRKRPFRVLAYAPGSRLNRAALGKALEAAA